MFAFALTGGIASGKSLFGRMLSALGAETLDADDVVRGLHRPGAKGAAAVAALFGASMLAPDGSTDRRRLGTLVFADQSARRRLEEALHPLVRSALLDWKNSPAPAGVPFRVAQIPLLFQSGWAADWDGSVTVETADEEARLARMAARGLSRAEALARIRSQMPAAERVRLAGFAVRNDSTSENLETIAREFFAAASALATTAYATQRN